MQRHDDHDHDDHGGLHRDLLATGALIGRRRLLRLAAGFGTAAGTLQLLGCGGDSPTSPSASGVVRSDIRSSFAGLSGSAAGVRLDVALTIVSASTCAPLAGYAQSLAAATNVANKTATSQIALPKTTNDVVYATAGYEASIRNAAQVTLASDNVFSDGSSLELATIGGDVAGGFTATLTVAV